MNINFNQNLKPRHNVQMWGRPPQPQDDDAMSLINTASSTLIVIPFSAPHDVRYGQTKDEKRALLLNAEDGDTVLLLMLRDMWQINDRRDALSWLGLHHRKFVIRPDFTDLYGVEYEDETLDRWAVQA